MPEYQIGDFVLLDDLMSDHQYEGRIHNIESQFRRNFTEFILTLGMPQTFNIYRNANFNVRFKLNRMPLRRMHAAVSSTYKPERLLFPKRNNVITGPQLPADALEPMFNHRIADDPQQLQTVSSIVRQSPGSAPFIIYGPYVGLHFYPHVPYLGVLVLPFNFAS